MIEVISFSRVVIDGAPAGTIAEALANHKARAGEIAAAATAWNAANEALIATATSERDTAIAEREDVVAKLLLARERGTALFADLIDQTSLDDIAKAKALAEAVKAKADAEAKIAELSR